MRKLFQSERWKRYVLKKSRKSLRRRQKRKKAHINRVASQSKITYPNIKKKKGKLEILAPSNFSLINNTEETLEFFNAVDCSVKQHKNIFFDLSQIKELTTDAIIYILSYLDFARHSHYNYSVLGNSPVDEKCNWVFKESGFYDYVYSKNPVKIKNDPNVYSIQSNNLVMANKAAEVKNFAKKRLNNSNQRDARSIYKNLIECMANTRNHAYLTNSLYTKWWLMASYNDEQKKVHFTFVDNGQGIPTTVKKRGMEIVREKFGNTPIIKLRDSELINSALKGEFRSKTGYRYRGKGLPRIHEEATTTEGKIKNLIIISKKGYINCTTGVIKELNKKFYGTLLSWDFV